MRVPDPSLAPNRAEGRRAIKALGAPALLSLIPWAAFIVAVAIADAVLDESASLGRLLAVSPFYLGFVALPCFLPIAAARSRIRRIAVVVAMTGVAVFAGVELVASDDAQAGLAVLLVPFVAIPLAFVVWLGESVAAGRAIPAPGAHGAAALPARPSERLAAFGIDAAIVVGVLIVPLTAVSKAGQDVAAGVIGVSVGTLYLGALIALRGGTIGHALVRLTVVDARTLGRVGFGRALARSLIVVLEAVAAPTLILAIPAVVELASIADTGRSLTDKLLKTSVWRRM